MQPAGFDDERCFPMTNSDSLNIVHILLTQWCQLSRFWRETYAFLPRLSLSRFGT